MKSICQLPVGYMIGKKMVGVIPCLIICVSGERGAEHSNYYHICSDLATKDDAQSSIVTSGS